MDVERAVLWDMDGTLIDSAACHWRAWEEIIPAEGRPFDPAYFRERFGQRNDTLLRGLFGADLPDAEVQRIGDAKEARYRELVAAAGVGILPGAERWLQRLCAAGWRQAIASSAPCLNIEAVLRATGIGRYFDAVVAGEDVTRGKPDPQVFETAAAMIGAHPGRCVVVEDSPFGVEGARRAGMRCVAVGPEFAGLGADMAAATLDALPEDAFERLVPR